MHLNAEYAVSRYYPELAAAFVRGYLGQLPDLTNEQIIQVGKAAGLQLHKFKRQAELPRVRRVLGILRGVHPMSLVDIGSGRGTFLWPLLQAFPDLQVTAVDIDPRRVTAINAVRRGGVSRLTAVEADATHLPFPNMSADIVTCLEVLEHVERPDLVVAEAVRVAQRFVIISVPSRPDNNPQHIHLFAKDDIDGLLRSSGARTVHFDFVLNHLIVTASLAADPPAE